MEKGYVNTAYLVLPEPSGASLNFLRGSGAQGSGAHKLCKGKPTARATPLMFLISCYEGKQH